MAKRCSNIAAAERYVAALRSIGARVELHAAADEANGASRRTHSSLPIPAPSVLAQVTESARVERETARAIARFRANEGLDGSMPAIEIDPVNPRIPKAPLVPHDLDQMPNARLPRFSDRPDWMLNDPLGEQGASDGPSFAAPHMNADPPPRPSAAPMPPSASSTRPPAPGTAAPSAAPETDSVPPSRTIGLAHAATASVRPGLGLLSSWRPGGYENVVKPRRRWPWRWIAAALAAVTLVAAVAFALFNSEGARRARAWREQGIEPGEYAPAAWLGQPGHGLRGASPAQLEELMANLAREGAPVIYALRISSTEAGERADALLIELPSSRDARRMILWHAARSSGLSPPLIPDRGQRIHVLEFPK